MIIFNNLSFGGNFNFSASNFPGNLIEILAIGAGQGGSINNYPGSGGAGGYFLRYTNNISNINIIGTTYAIQIGAGGTGKANTSYGMGASGGNTTFIGGAGLANISIKATGGVGYGTFQTATGPYTGTNGAGGSGAGGSQLANGDAGPGTNANSTVSLEIVAAGGTVFGELSGGTYYYGGGGGNPLRKRGVGYGGNPNTITNGGINSGGGGAGGGGLNGRQSTDGGSGVVLIKTPYYANATTGSNLVVSSNGYYYYMFTGTGSITF